MGDSPLKNAHPSAQQAHDGRSMRERLLAGDLYIADDPQLAAESRHAAKLTQQFNTSDPSDPQARLAVLRDLLGSLGEGAEIRPPLLCDYGYQIHVGARTFINYGAVLLDVATITIGEDVQVGPNVQFLTCTGYLGHLFGKTTVKAREHTFSGCKRRTAQVQCEGENRCSPCHLNPNPSS